MPARKNKILHDEKDKAIRRVIRAAVELHKRPRAEDLYADRFNYDLIMRFDNACAALVDRLTRAA